MERSWVVVCLGGALGSGLRFGISTWAYRHLSSAFPLGTLLVNVVGSFFIGLLMPLLLKVESTSPALRPFWVIGVLGGFTTYSSFSYETVKLFQEGWVGFAVLNAAATLLGCLTATALGFMAAQWISR